ncbi:Phenylalanyl-tRNA synthetase beta subunit [Aphelenchoides fujianensis]|nr:Phenylalanyl-tRNA synthetase beta subunit [Aphelenchoides fujianensis]
MAAGGKKRVVIVHPDLGIGGAERLVLDAALAYREAGHDVSIVTNQFNIHVCARWIPRSIFGVCTALCAYIRLCWAALFVLFRMEVDVVFMDSVSSFLHFTCRSSSSACSRGSNGRHLVFYCHFPDLLLTQRRSALKKFYRFFVDGLERQSIGLADKIYVNSRFTKGICEEAFPSLSSHNSLDVLYPTLRTELLDQPADLAKIAHLKLDRFEHVFLSINRYEVKKNIGLAIEAFAVLRDQIDSSAFRKTGGISTELNKLADDLELRDHVIFLKSPSDQEKVALLERCQLVVYTPKFEHFGIVPLEAMYMRRCVLAVNAGGPTETVRHEQTGFLCEDTPDEFAAVLRTAVEDPERIRRLGAAGKQRVLDHFSFQSFSRKLNSDLPKETKPGCFWVVCGPRCEMPTVNVKKRLLDSTLGKKYTQHELDEIFFDFGLELDDVEEIYKIEVPANRYDLLCVEGLSRALRVFMGKEKTPKYEIRRPEKPIVLKVEKSTKEIREFVVSAVLRNVTIDKDVYASFIDLQDKLHQNICRKRTLASVGTHDLDTIQPPFVYRAEKPENIRFVPLNKTKEYNARDLLELYKTDLHLREFVPIIVHKPLYPVIYDANNHSKITLNTKNIFIEATATDLKKAEVVLDTLVTMFGQYAKEPFTVEPVQVVYEDGRLPPTEYPKLSYRKQTVNVERVNGKIGVKLTAAEVARSLDKMCLAATPKGDQEVEVTIPPTRHDILHECDIAEDVALAFGYNNIVTQLPAAHTVAQPFPLNKLSDQLRLGIANAGWTEVLNFVLCSSEDISSKLRRADGLENSVKIANPKTLEFQVVRNSLLPGLLKTLSNNRDMPLPLKLFEVQDVVMKNPTADTKTKNQRNAAAVFYNKTGSFEVIHGLLDRIMELLGIPLRSSGRPVRLLDQGIRRMLSDCFLIIAIAVFTALLGEGLTWVLVYRSEEYKRLKDLMERKTKRLEKKKENTESSTSKTTKKKIEREEERLKNVNRDLSMFRMKSMLAIGFVFTALLSTFSSIFEGRVVAKLPFEPIPWIQGNHRNLIGDDYTDCSFIFLYILCTMSLRQNLQKMLGFAPSRALSRQGQSGGFFAQSASQNPFGMR